MRALVKAFYYFRLINMMINRDADINPAARFSNISDSELDHRMSGIKVSHPNIGEVMASGHVHVRRFDVDPTRVDVDGNDWKRDGNAACVVLIEALDVALGACLALLLDCRKEKHNAL